MEPHEGSCLDHLLFSLKLQMKSVWGKLSIEEAAVLT